MDGSVTSDANHVPSLIFSRWQPTLGRCRIWFSVLLVISRKTFVYFAGDKFVRHGAVGARLIHASAHARLRWWGAFKLLPSAFDLSSIQVGGDFYR